MTFDSGRHLDQARGEDERDEVRHVGRRRRARGDGGDRRELGLPIRLVAVIGATENMPVGRARTSPATSCARANGTTIEVINTDAEGRLVLADCLAHARRAGRRAARRRRDADRRDRHRARVDLRRAGRRRRRLGAAVDGRGQRDRRDRLAAAAAPRVRELDQGPLRRPRQRGRGPQGAARSPPRSSCSASPATCRGRTSTSPGGAGRPRARRTRPRAGGLGVRLLSSSPASAAELRRRQTLSLADGLRPLRPTTS